MHTYINGYREGVIFAFYNKDTQNILLEIRNKEKTDIFFTNGSIETKDKSSTSYSNYKLNALIREVTEEFAANIRITEADCNYIDTIFVEEIKIVFYIYLITNWQGTFPDYTIEENEKFAELIWLPLDEAEATLPFESGKIILKLLRQHL